MDADEVRHVRGLSHGTTFDIFGERRYDYLNTLRARDHVSIGDDVAIGINNDAGTELALAPDQRCFAFIGLLDPAESRHQHLNNCGRRLRHECLEGSIELPQNVCQRTRLSGLLPIRMSSVVALHIGELRLSQTHLG